MPLSFERNPRVPYELVIFSGKARLGNVEIFHGDGRNDPAGVIHTIHMRSRVMGNWIWLRSMADDKSAFPDVASVKAEIETRWTRWMERAGLTRLALPPEDTRPENCRFRLQDEGKSYPRSGCHACGKDILTGLGMECQDRRGGAV